MKERKDFIERYTRDVYKPEFVDPYVNTLEYIETTDESALLLTKQNEIEIEFFLRYHGIVGREKELILRKLFNIKR